MKKGIYNKLKKLVESGYVKKNFDLTDYNTYKLKSVCSIAILVN
jgi:Fe2+ or Zn2+ uptake regulation protein